MGGLVRATEIVGVRFCESSTLSRREIRRRTNKYWRVSGQNRGWCEVWRLIRPGETDPLKDLNLELEVEFTVRRLRATLPRNVRSQWLPSSETNWRHRRGGSLAGLRNADSVARDAEKWGHTILMSIFNITDDVLWATHPRNLDPPDYPFGIYYGPSFGNLSEARSSKPMMAITEASSSVAC